MLTIDRLDRNGRPVPTQELLNYVNSEMEKRGFHTVTLRTLQRDFVDIDLQFGYKVRSNGREYTIERSSGYLPHRFDELMLDFDLLSALNSDAHLQRYVLAEHHRPVGSQLMFPLIQAIRESRVIEFDYVLYPLRLRITNDFVMELLSRSRSLTVIRPQSLRERIRKVYEEALKRNSI
jgi:predicted DNA-binding transcriptional regulator YafY